MENRISSVTGYICMDLMIYMEKSGCVKAIMYVGQHLFKILQLGNMKV